MGDRANVVISESTMPPVFLYTHWGGEGLPELVRDSLIRGQSRWNDGIYLARIVFTDMIRDHLDDLTGFGISAVLCDNEHPLIVLEPEAQTIALHWEAGAAIGDQFFVQPIADFVENPEPLRAAYAGTYRLPC